MSTAQLKSGDLDEFGKFELNFVEPAFDKIGKVRNAREEKIMPIYMQKLAIKAVPSTPSNIHNLC